MEYAIMAGIVVIIIAVAWADILDMLDDIRRGSKMDERIKHEINRDKTIHNSD